MVLRCDDCISYHVAQCRDAGVTRDEMFEAFSVGLVVGGSIVIPHLRRAVDSSTSWNKARNRPSRTSTENPARHPGASRVPACAGITALGGGHNCGPFFPRIAFPRDSCLPEPNENDHDDHRACAATASAPRSWTPPCTCSTRCGSACSTNSPMPAWSRWKKHGELLPQATLDSIARNKVALKSPLTTPVGEGFQSINVELRQRFDLVRQRAPGEVVPEHEIALPDGRDLVTVRARTPRAPTSAKASRSATTAPPPRCGHPEGDAQGFRAHRALRLRPRRGTPGARRSRWCTKANILKSTSACSSRSREVAAQYPEIACNETDRRQLLHAAGDEARAVRRDRHHQPVRRHHFSDLCAAWSAGSASRRAPTSASTRRSSRRCTVRPRDRRPGHRQPCALLLAAMADARPPSASPP